MTIDPLENAEPSASTPKAATSQSTTPRKPIERLGDFQVDSLVEWPVPHMKVISCDSLMLA